MGTTPPLIPSHIGDLSLAIRSAGKNRDLPTVATKAAEAFDTLDLSLALLASQVGAGGSAEPAPAVATTARLAIPFWFGQGENQPADSTLNLNEYVVTFPPLVPPVSFTKIVWQYALVYNYNSPAPTTDWLAQFYLEGVAIFDANNLKLPSGTTVGNVITVNNFLNPSSAVVEKNRITGRIVQTDNAIVNLEVKLVFDLSA
jgi:hypothetical protein